MKKIIGLVFAAIVVFGVFIAGTPVKAAEECELTFDPNGGNEFFADGVYESGLVIDIPADGPERFGYNFLGWSESATAATPTYLPEDTFTITGDTTLYAVWKEASVITRSDDIITAAPVCESNNHVYYKIVPAEASAGVVYSLSTNDTYVSLYNGNGDHIMSNDDGGDEGNFCLFYEFEKGTTYYVCVKNYFSQYTDPVDFIYDDCYTVSYNTGVEDVSVESSYAVKGEECIVSYKIPARENYVFGGWAFEADASVGDFVSGQTFTPTGNTTLYAVWDKADYAITYYMDNGTVDTVQYKKKDIDITLDTEYPVGYTKTFMGWTTDKSSTEISYYPGDTYNKNANLDLYPIFEPMRNLGEISDGTKCTLTFPMPGSYRNVEFTVPETGSYIIYSKSGTEGDEEAVLYDEDWDEVDDDDDADGMDERFCLEADLEKGKSYYIEVSFISYEIEDLELNFERAYTITYDGNGGECHIGKQYVSKDRNNTISEEVPKRSGYYFGGWATSADGTKVYDSGDAYSEKKDIVLYAVWSDGKYTITYESDEVENQEFAQGSNVVLRKDRLEPAFGKCFEGWATTSNASSAQYKPGQRITLSSDLTLYPVWSDAPVISGVLRAEVNDAQHYDYIIFIPPETGTYRIHGAGTEDNQVRLYDEDGTFIALNDDSDYPNLQFGMEKELIAGKKYYIMPELLSPSNENIPFEIEKLYEITLEMYNDIETAIINIYKAHDESIEIYADVPEREGHVFAGWGASDDTAVVAIENGGIYTTNAPLHLYSVWRRCLEITNQPQDAEALEGEIVEVTVEAEGEGVTYQWYIKNKGDTKYSKSSITSNTYSTVMDESRDGRILQCVVRDAFGGMIKSDVVTISMKAPTELKIIQQPVSTAVYEGELASAAVEAEGDGLTYQWYIKNKGDTKYSKSSITSNVYQTNMTAAKDGRILQCVIKDKYGSMIKSDVVTITMKNELRITQQPVNTSVANGEMASVTVEAEGDDLIYRWYIKNKGDTKYTKSSITTSTYSAVMNESRDGRILQCVIKDKYGSMIKSDVVTITMLTENPLRITQQPKSASAAEGETVKVTVAAEGDGVTYQWYIKNKGDSKYSKSSITSNVYQTNMTAAKDGRILQCVIKDKYGSMIKSDVVTITMLAETPLRITQQPVSASAADGEYVSVTVKAQGDGVTYQWWIKNPGDEAYTKSSITSDTYTTKMTAAKDGRILRCVIKDKYGNLVRSDIVTINME